MSSYICPNPKLYNTTSEPWGKLFTLSDHTANEVSPLVTSAQFLLVILTTMGEAMYMQEQGYMVNLCTFLSLCHEPYSALNRKKKVFTQKSIVVQYHLHLLQETLEGAFPHELVYLSQKKKEKKKWKGFL